MEYVTSRDGTRIAYDRGGDGSPVVLVHGTTADHTTWDRVREFLEANHMVYAMDRRGRGVSGDADEYDVRREFEDITTLVESIGGSVDLVGHSYGAVCALGASRRTDALQRMVLYEPPLWTPGADLGPKDALEKMEEQLDREAHEEVLETFFREVTRSEDRLQLYRSDPSWPDRVATAPTIPREVRTTASYRPAPNSFGHVETPTRVLLGEKTEGRLMDGTEAAHEYLQNSELVVLEGQGHATTFTAPEMLADVTGEFLANG